MTRKGPLEGLRIADFTWVVSGPFGTSIMGDLGADVIKIEGRERPPVGPQYKFFSTWNRSKLGVIINMRHPKGLELAKRLIKISDVVMENFSAGVMESWGLGYDVMKQVKPDIIYVSMAGFGHSGPYRDYISHGMTLQALSGFTYLTGVPGDIPVCTGSYADFNGGLYAAMAVLAALEYRRQTGKGQYIDLSQLEAQTATLGTAILEYTTNCRAPQPTANRLPHPAAAPHGTYPCAGDDRWCALAAFDEEQWQALCHVIGDPPWTQEPRFATLPQRVQHADELDQLLGRWTSKQTAEEVMERLQRVGVAAGVVQNAQDLYERDPHLQARGFWERAPDPVLGETTFEGQPIKMSNAQCHVRRGAPLFGEHNDYVFRQLLGMSEGEIREYTEEGVFKGVPA